MAHPINRHVNSYRYAAKGVHYTLTTQVNIWVQLLSAIMVMLLAYFLDFTLEQYLILVLTIGFVITAELLNTALEELVDLVSPEFHHKAGLVKDIAAGAVMVAAATAAIIGILLFVPPLLAKF